MAHNETVRRTWIDRVFQREEMDGDGRCPIYLIRWTLLKFWGGRSLYLHHFVGDDWSWDLHDHPKRFISIGLWGRYRETSMQPCWVYGSYHGEWERSTHPVERTYRAPWIRTFPAHHIHRIELVENKSCWTLVLVLKNQRAWGFWHDGTWIEWREYVGSEIASKMKSCS